MKFYRDNLSFHEENQILIFDVGANVGEKTRVFLKLGGKVIAFEPQPDCVKELNHRCGNNNNLIIINSGLSSTEGKGELYVRPHRGASGLVKEWEGNIESVIDVNLVTLDNMIEIHVRPFYIKIDVEGYEFEVLKGLSQKIPLISFEYHLRENDIQKAVKCINYLSEISEVSLNITPAESLIFKFPCWKSKEEFFKILPNDFDKKSEFAYGDIWVKM